MLVFSWLFLVFGFSQKTLHPKPKTTNPKPKTKN